MEDEAINDTIYTLGRILKQAGGQFGKKTVILKFKFSWDSLYVCFVKKMKPQ